MARFMISSLYNSSGLDAALDCSLKQNSSKCSQFLIPASLSSVLEQNFDELGSFNDLLQFKAMDEQQNKELLTYKRKHMYDIKNYE